MSSSNSNSSASGGIGVAGLLGVAFVILKLVHEIAWSWWWVLAPFWIPAAITVLILLGVLAGVALFGSRRTRKAVRR